MATPADRQAAAQSFGKAAPAKSVAKLDRHLSDIGLGTGLHVAGGSLTDAEVSRGTAWEQNPSATIPGASLETRLLGNPYGLGMVGEYSPPIYPYTIRVEGQFPHVSPCLRAPRQGYVLRTGMYCQPRLESTVYPALEKSSLDQRVAVIKGTHTGALHPKLRGGGTGIIRTFNQNNAAVHVAYTDSLHHSARITLQEAARLLRGGWGGDGTFHGASRTITLDRFTASVPERWGLPVKVEWERISSKPDKFWHGIRMFGYECVPVEDVSKDLFLAGVPADGPEAPVHDWKRLEERALMRSTASTARSWQGFHEAKRAELEAFIHAPEIFSVIQRQLKELRSEWKNYGPAAREVLRRRPAPTREQRIRRFYLSRPHPG